MRWLLLVEYAGDRFQGWQSQPNGETVADHLARAVASIAGHPVRLACAGRTDAGVHALAQAVHFDTCAERPASAWVRGVNAHLPPGVAVWHAQPVADTFHARYSARARRYRYLLMIGAQRPAAWAGKVGWFHRPLDLAAMQEAAGALLGRHDFSAFRAAECQAKTPVRTLTCVAVTAIPGGFAFDFEADGFLHHMVRNLVGALVYVGKGYAPPEWIAELLVARDRRRAPPTFMADGLYFCGVDYGACPELPGRGRIIRLPALGITPEEARGGHAGERRGCLPFGASGISGNSVDFADSGGSGDSGTRQVSDDSGGECGARPDQDLWPHPV